MRVRASVVAVLMSVGLTSGADAGEEGDRFDALNAFFETNPAFFPNGVGLAIVQDGALIYRETFHGFDETTPTSIASSSKWISGLAIADAITEPGAPTLVPATRVSSWVPAFADSVGPDGLPDKRRITLAQAFSHVSGLPENGAGRNFHLDWSTTHELAVEDIAGLEMAGEPGGQLIYGGLAMHAAGLAVANALGTDWTTLVRERLFDPLNMVRTDYDAFTGEAFIPTANPGVAGTIRTTLSEYTNFVTMLNQGGVFGGRRVVRQSAIDVLLTDFNGAGIEIVSSPYQRYESFVPGVSAFRTGFGCFIDPARVSTAGEVRWATSAGAWGTNAWIDLDRRIAGVMFTYNDERWLNEIDPELGTYNPSTRAFLEFVRPLIEDAIPVTCDEDLTRDGAVGPEDLFVVLAGYGVDGRGDTDGDGDTDPSDLFRVLAAFGEACAGA